MKPVVFLATALQIVAVFYSIETDATVCAPYSKFKIDCNNCECSKDGKEYTCTRDVVCTPRSLKFADDDYVLPPPIEIDASGRPRPRVPRSQMIPYINDEIEVIGRKNGRSENNDFFFSEGNSNEYKKEPQNFEDVGLDEQVAEELDENDVSEIDISENDRVPDRFKFKRSVRFY